MQPITERRKHPRHPLNTGMQFYHGPSRRDIPGRCVDISRGGLMMQVPMTSPVKAGDSLQVSLGAHNRPEFLSLSDKPLDASVVRVDRHPMLKSGTIAVGVKFTSFKPAA